MCLLLPQTSWIAVVCPYTSHLGGLDMAWLVYIGMHSIFLYQKPSGYRGIWIYWFNCSPLDCHPTWQRKRRPNLRGSAANLDVSLDLEPKFQKQVPGFFAKLIWTSDMLSSSFSFWTIYRQEQVDHAASQISTINKVVASTSLSQNWETLISHPGKNKNKKHISTLSSHIQKKRNNWSSKHETQWLKSCHWSFPKPVAWGSGLWQWRSQPSRRSSPKPLPGQYLARWKVKHLTTFYFFLCRFLSIIWIIKCRYFNILWNIHRQHICVKCIITWYHQMCVCSTSLVKTHCTKQG